MQRRTFLRSLVLGAAGVAATAVVPDVFVEDPDKALWVPGRRTFFDFGDVMPHETLGQYNETLDQYTFEHVYDFDLPSEVAEVYAREMLRVLDNNLAIARRVHREYDTNFLAVGDRITFNSDRQVYVVDQLIPTVTIRPEYAGRMRG
jgi:hypothetical protein